MDNPIRKQIAQRLRELRNEKGWSQEEAARHIGCSWRAVQRWERGHAQPQWESIEKIARAYNVTTSQIVGQDDVSGLQPESVEARLDRLTLQVSDLSHRLNSLIQRLGEDPDDSIAI